MSTPTEADRARIRARYPQPDPRHRTRLLVALMLGAVLVAWMTWAGLARSNPPVTADVHGFVIVDDNTARADLRVQRTDPSQPVVCTLQATAENFVQVGELQERIGPGTEKITRHVAQLRTVNRATTVTVEGCRPA